MAITAAFAQSVLEHFFQNANIALIGDATGLRGSSTAGSYYLSLHTAAPGSAGTQATSECNYTSYARVAVVRSAVGWDLAADGTLSNAATVTFPESTGGAAQNATHIGIGTASSGAGLLVTYVPTSADIPIDTGVVPTFPAGQIVVNVT